MELNKYSTTPKRQACLSVNMNCLAKMKLDKKKISTDPVVLLAGFSRIDQSGRKGQR